MPDTLDRYRDWIGRSHTMHDVATAGAVARMAATLDRLDPEPRDGDEVPPGWQILYFLESAPQRRLGPDGHIARGDFLPSFPRRMFAGGRMQFVQPLRIGERITMRSEITDIAIKQGRSGPLAFMTTRETVSGEKGICLNEEKDLVFRGPHAAAMPPPQASPPPADPQFFRHITPDPALLFRFSALVFTAHRIHYDFRYTTVTEGYRGLIVHGPLLALLLLDLLRRERPDAKVGDFRFRSQRPVFDTGPFRIAGRIEGQAALLWAEDDSGALAMRAEARLA
jgi:3-methylfumaryl-CoA hydratase